MSDIQSARKKLSDKLEALRVEAEKLVVAINALDAIEPPAPEKKKAPKKTKAAKPQAKKTAKPMKKRGALEPVGSDAILEVIGDERLAPKDVAAKLINKLGLTDKGQIALLKQRIHPNLSRLAATDKLARGDDGLYSKA